VSRTALTVRVAVDTARMEWTLEDETGRFGAGVWLRFPVGSSHAPSTAGGCVLYVKECGFESLQSA